MARLLARLALVRPEPSPWPLAWAVALVLAFPSIAWAWQDERLNRVASVFAMRPVGIECASIADDPELEYAFGYVHNLASSWVPIGRQKLAHLRESVCAAGLRLNDPLLPVWERALAVSVLVHESYHLRRWGAALVEWKVECTAVRHWKVGARLLGATEATIVELWPAALALHYELTRVFDMRTLTRPYDGPCDVPPLYEDE